MSNEQEKVPTDFQKLTLLLAEKRTAHTTLRSGIALCAFSMTLISFLLLMASKLTSYYEEMILVVLGFGSMFLLALGGYFLRRGFSRMRFHDIRINEILSINHEASDLFYHTRKRNNIQPTKGAMYYDVVFHFDKGSAELDIAISNIKNYIEGLTDQKFTICLVVNGPGIKLLGKDDPHAQKLTELAKLGLQIKVCRNAMNHFQIQPEWLLPSSKIVRAGLLEIIALQRKGYAYIKP